MTDASLMGPNTNNAEIDLSMKKVSIVGSIGVVCALLFGYFLSVNDLMLTGIFGVAFFTAFILQAFFIKGEALSAWFVLGESAALILPFANHFSYILVIAGAVTFTLLWLANRRGKDELSNQLKVRFGRVERVVARETLTAIAVFISIIYIAAFNTSGALVSKSTLQTILRPAEPILSKLMFNFSLDMTVNQFIENSLTSGLTEQEITSVLGSKANQQALVNQSLETFQKKLSAFNLQLSGQKTVLDTLYGFLTQKTKDWSEQYNFTFSFGAFLLIFFFLNGIFTIARFLLVIPAYILFELAMAFGFAYIAIESRAREIILLK